jgi:hypothetical protein
MVLANPPAVEDILLKMAEHTAICIAVVFGLIQVARLFKTYVGRPMMAAWRRSGPRRYLRAWWLSRPKMSQARAVLLIGLIGNGLVVLFCLPLLSVPPGSGVKPMTLPLLFILVAAVTFASARKAVFDADRPVGWRLLREFGLLLCLLPLPAGVVAMHMCAAARNLVFG